MLLRQRIQVYVRTISLLAVIVAVSVSLGLTRPTAAVETANTLKVSPVRSDVEVKAGSSKTIMTTVTNLTDQPISVKAITNDFIAGDERGTPALILDADKYAPTHSLKKFMQPIGDITIPAKKTEIVNVVIKVPKDAQAGGYFGAVRFAPTDPDGGGQVNLSASVASIILMTVPGPTVEKLTMTDFDIQQGGRTGTYFQSANDLQVSLRLESKSNVQVGPFGKISVKQGDKVVYDYDFNGEDPRDMVLPDSARRWDIPLKNIDSFGYYTVYATITYGKANQTIEISKSFWVIPWIVIAIAAGAVLLLVGIIIAIIVAIRRRKRGHGRSVNFRRY